MCIRDSVRTKILKQTETEIEEMDEQMAKEIEDGIIPDPNMPVDPATGMPADQALAGYDMMGTVPEGMPEEGAPMNMPKGGEI